MSIPPKDPLVARRARRAIEEHLAEMRTVQAEAERAAAKHFAGGLAVAAEAERQAFGEDEQTEPALAGKPLPRKSSAEAVRKAVLAVGGRPRKSKIDQLRETKIIRELLSLGLKGMDYCRAVDDCQIPTRRDWQREGCPNSYAQAYRHPKWRKRIQDEKTRLSRR